MSLVFLLDSFLKQAIKKKKKRYKWIDSHEKRVYH